MPVGTDERSWTAKAACRGTSSRLFNSHSPEANWIRHQREVAAKQICAECPVRQECLDYALRVEETFGIWGGLTESEQRELPHAPTNAT